MINLLPPELKLEISYAKRNSALIRLILTTAVATAVVVLLLNNGASSLDKNITNAKKELATEETAQGDAKTVAQIQSVNAKLSAINQLNQTKHHYSAVLRDFAKALPAGAWIDNMVLTGDNKPLKLSINAKTSDVANKVKDSLLTCPRIASVDIASINTAPDGSAIVAATVTFKPGQDK